jgi:hypothetical protein
VEKERGRWEHERGGIERDRDVKREGGIVGERASERNGERSR